MAEKGTIVGKVVLHDSHAGLCNSHRSCSIADLNREGRNKQLCCCLLCDSTWGVSALNVSNTSEYSNHYLGAVLCDLISCTSYLGFNWGVQQFEGWKCLHQWAGECTIDSVLGVCWRVRNSVLFFHGATAKNRPGPPLYRGFVITQTQGIGHKMWHYSYCVH